MKQAHAKIVLRILLAGGVAWGLVILALSTLGLAAQPAQAHGLVEPLRPAALARVDFLPAGRWSQQSATVTSTPGVSESIVAPPEPLAGYPFVGRPVISTPPLPPQIAELMAREGDLEAAADDLVLLKTVATGSGDPAVVFNGEFITYTITISNGTAGPITDIFLLDVLSVGTLDNVTCLNSNCSPITSPVVFTDEAGSLITSEVTLAISSEIASLAPGAIRQAVFSGRVVCQRDGTILSNHAQASYRQGGQDKFGNSNEVQTTVRVRLERSGQVNLSDGPTWCSNDVGGTLGMDWGDFDNDGDLDLALGATGGTTVYRNEQGQLTSFWTDPRSTLDVRWGNLDSDHPYLELVAVGDSINQSFLEMGTNYIYSYNGSDFDQTGSFTSTLQLLRVDLGDLDGDGRSDLIGTTNAFDDPCAVSLYRNQAGTFTTPELCLLGNSSWAGAAFADFDNDGDLDVAVHDVSVDQAQIFTNSGGSLATTNLITIELDNPQQAYNLAWGDYNGDGYMDLAAAFRGGQTVGVYRNLGGSQFAAPIKISVPTFGFFFKPISLDWADFNGDGRLELAVDGPLPRIYQYRASPVVTFTPIITLTPGVIDMQHSFWDIRGIDHDNDGDPDLTMSNRDGASLLFTMFSPLLNPTLTPIKPPQLLPAAAAGSVAWGDADGDGDLDLLFGAGPATGGLGAFGSKLYSNQAGTFSADDLDVFAGFGPHGVAFGDLDADGDLDIALGTLAEEQIYLAGELGSPAWVSQPPHLASPVVAWGDADYDDDLDLLVGNNGPETLFINAGSQLATSPLWTGPVTDDTRSLAWGDYNNDHHLDFAVGNSNQPNRLYRNDKRNNFTLVWTAPVTQDTRSVAWGDYDDDGDLDLAVGNYEQPNYIYENSSNNLSLMPVWTSTNVSGTPISRRTTSLAWGDWDNDGDLDLAVGNDGQPDQVYVNLGSRPGLPQLAWIWRSAESYPTTGVAWGDPDGDGDLDLAISQGGNGQNGIYENHYIQPSHLTGVFTPTIRLPHQPSYLSIERPGTTATSDFFSSAEILSGEVNPTVTIRYRLFDPDGTRASGIDDAPGDTIIKTIYEYSLNGGGDWKEASPMVNSPTPISTTSRLGQLGTFLWDAQQDEAISDNVRFRITIIPQDNVGPVQRASTSAISPPFRAQGLRCVWPKGPKISHATSDGKPPQPSVPIDFMGTVGEGSGVLIFTWNFGDNSPQQVGQLVSHTYGGNNTYLTTLTVNGVPCPITEPASITQTIRVGTGQPDLYFPLIQKPETVSSTVTPPELTGPILKLRVTPGTPTQVTGLAGSVQAETGATHLAWSPNPSGEAVLGYRLYRARIGIPPFRLLAELPAQMTTYEDTTATCGQMYLITAYNSAGESLPSLASYFSPPCRVQ